MKNSDHKLSDGKEYSVVEVGDMVRIYFYPDSSDKSKFIVFYSHEEFNEFREWYLIV